MISKQIDEAVDEYLDEEFGPSSFAEFASNRFGIEFEAHDFRRCSYEEAEKLAHEKAQRSAPSFIQEALDECLPEEDDPKEWKWQELARRASARYGAKITDRELRQLGRDGVSPFFMDKAVAAIQAIDLQDGAKFLSEDWGIRSICDWLKKKFLLKVTVEEIRDKNPGQIKEILEDKVMEAYKQKEIEFPVQVAMANYMSEKAAAGASKKYDRGGLFMWAKVRFGALADGLNEEDFLTQSRNRLYERLLDLSRQTFPPSGHTEIDAQIAEAFEGTRLSEADDAQELSNWAKEHLKLDIDPSHLTGVTRDQARQTMWNAYDVKYRPEMRSMERSLVLSQLDSAWKSHLLTMDHLRSTVGLRGIAQEDPKIVYKREGMKEFDLMKESLEDRITDTIFRMEEAEGFQESIWSIGAAVHETYSAGATYEQEQLSTNAAASEKRKEPIRNKTAKVGRNDPCPCGSGKKYKNCCMRVAGHS
jgi:preprotein translocase subunit SecA